MRKISFVAIGLVVAACGGGDANEAPKTPVTPAASAPPPVASATAEAPKEEAKPKETLAQLQEKAVKAHVEATNARDAKKLAGLYSETSVVKIAGAPMDANGREGVEKSYQKLFEAFPDYKTAPSRVWMSGDVVVVEWAFNGTHTGDLWGIKATEKKVGAQGVDVLWFTPEGQIKEHHVYYDGGTILSQIGISKQKARSIPALPASAQPFSASGAPEEAKNLDAVKAMVGAIESKKEADFLAPLAETVEQDDMTQPQTSKGKGDAKKYFKEVTTGFPDSKIAIANTWTAADFVITETVWTGTHKGSFFGMPATKKPVTVKSVMISQLKDGKIVKGWSYANGADMMMQLGQMPSPSAPKPGAKPADPKAPVPAAKPADPKAPAAKPATPAPKK